MHSIRIVFLTTLALLVVAPVAAHAEPVSSTSQVGAVSATISWDETDGETTGITLEVRRGDAVALTGPITFRNCSEPYCRVIALGRGTDAPSVTVRNVDADAEPEVLVAVFTGGAHCCTQLSLFDWNGTTYTRTQRDFGNGFVTIAGQGGATAFKTIDDRFAYRFASYAGSWLPVRLLALRRGRFVDVSRSYPALLRADAARAWRTAREQCRSTDEFAASLGAYAGWAANQYRLGLRRATLATLRREQAAGCFKGDGTVATGTFIATLDRFLLRPNPA